MESSKYRSTIKKSLFTIGILALVIGLVACAPQAQTNDKGKEADSKPAVETPKADEFGVVSAESWKDIYPEVYASYEANLDNAPGASIPQFNQ